MSLDQGLASPAKVVKEMDSILTLDRVNNIHKVTTTINKLIAVPRGGFLYLAYTGLCH